MNGPLLLTLIWVLPFVIAGATMALDPRNHRGVKTLSLAGNGVNLGLIIMLTAGFLNDSATGPDHPVRYLWKARWLDFLHVDYHVGVDAISALMILLTGIVIFCGILASWNLKEQTREFFILLNVLVGGVYGVFVSFDLFTLFLFYEVAVLPMYLLIGLWGTGRKEYAAMKLTLMLVAGSALILGGILALYFESGLATFDLLRLSSIRFSPELQAWAFPALFVGFGVLSALFPFHTWSPDGHAAAPTAVSMLHAGVLMKLGGYGCLRVAMYLLPEGAQFWMPYMLVLITVNVVYGALGALRQTDLKYITAYSSVSHCGLVLFGLAAMTVAGLKGAVLQMISHGLMTALFFALIGMIYGRTHTREIGEMGGLMKVMPFLSVSFVIAGLAGLGLPGLSGFIAEVTVFLGAFMNPAPLNRVCTVLAVLSIVITAVYVLRTANRVVNGPIREAHLALKDATLVERMPVLILLAAIVGMGVFPGWIIAMVDAAVHPIAANILR